ncbi:MAG: PEP-CTERM sorting domain-containing protein [Phycisphaera sp.]|nr:PEP-CTERM sorting domain-containing protein [Phycisphaera sp.]
MTRIQTLTLAVVLGLGSAVGTAQAALITVDLHDFASIKRGPVKETSSVHPKNEAAGTTDRFGLIRFDSTDFGASVDTASLKLTPGTWAAVTSTSFTFYFWGVKEAYDSYDDELFVQATYDPSHANSLYDGSSEANSELLDQAQTTYLGSATFNKDGGEYSFSSAAMLSFIQADTNDVVTIAITRAEAAGNSVLNSPKLELTTIPEPASLVLMGLGGLLMLPRRKK